MSTIKAGPSGPAERNTMDEIQIVEDVSTGAILIAYFACALSGFIIGFFMGAILI